ncbi:alpha/beta fold hydrolase [Kribbella sp. CA-253562]|uniref:alpha/beta fold hydrolase n=1 Tax=Kribbella sp. CA-253562 TaxID=3239942 RepID=UPI003D8F8E74
MVRWSRARTSAGQSFVFAECGQGPLVVFWHGFPDTPHSWSGIMGKVAAAGYRAVAPWLRGYHPETVVDGLGYGPLELAQETGKLLDALGERDAVLVGHDWGGILAYGAASLAPERIRALVPVSFPLPTLIPRTPVFFWTVRHIARLKLPLATESLRRGDFSYVDKLYRRWAPNWSGPTRDHAIAEVKSCFRNPASLEAAIQYYRDMSPRTPPELTHAPTMPGLVVGGTNDLAPPGTIERTAAALGDDWDHLILDGAGHWPHLENEPVFIDRLLDFLRTLPRPA